MSPSWARREMHRELLKAILALACAFIVFLSLWFLPVDEYQGSPDGLALVPEPEEARR